MSLSNPAFDIVPSFKIPSLVAALQEIIEVASGERQVADDDTGGMAWIDKRARAALTQASGEGGT
jgi:hypothetical protein